MKDLTTSKIMKDLPTSEIVTMLMIKILEMAILILALLQLYSILNGALNSNEVLLSFDSGRVEISADIVLGVDGHTCMGAYTTEKDRGMNSIIWVCDNEYISYDESGSKFPTPNKQIENF